MLAWTGAAHWLAGNESECAVFAARAYEAAQQAGDDGALATAHLALALCAGLSGDPMGMETNFDRALGLAEAAGDKVLQLRIRVNLAASLERQGKLREALSVLGPAVALADVLGYASWLGLALANEGALLYQLGRLDDAAISFSRAVQMYQRMRSRKVAYPLTGLGDLHRLRGQPAQAKAAYNEALRAASADSDNRQAMVPALAGLARVMSEDDPAAAAALADRAVDQARGPWVTAALVARAWVNQQAGRPDDARTDAKAAADAAQHRDRTGLAHALEVAAAVSDDPAHSRRSLHEALAIWTESGAELEADRIRVELGRRGDGNGDQRLLGRLAASRPVSAGVAVPQQVRAPNEPEPVEVHILGSFTVLISGRPLPLTAWQSRKARDLLRALVARRGRPVSREELTDLLWGPVTRADQDKVGHRLSVTLSTLRAVLDPDRRAPVDHFVVASPANIAVDLCRLIVDVEEMFAQARYGLRLRERGEVTDALAVLTAAEQAYTGEAFADDPYPEWTRPLREEARATYLHLLRVLVQLSQDAGDVDAVVRYLLRILTTDQHDEQAHRDLIDVLADAGRHGEASRAYHRYREAMRDIGVPVRAVRGPALTALTRR